MFRNSAGSSHDSVWINERESQVISSDMRFDSPRNTSIPLHSSSNLTKYLCKNDIILKKHKIGIIIFINLWSVTSCDLVDVYLRFVVETASIFWV